METQTKPTYILKDKINKTNDMKVLLCNNTILRRTEIHKLFVTEVLAFETVTLFYNWIGYCHS